MRTSCGCCGTQAGGRGPVGLSRSSSPQRGLADASERLHLSLPWSILLSERGGGSCSGQSEEACNGKIALIFKWVEDPRTSNARCQDFLEMLTVALPSSLCGGLGESAGGGGRPADRDRWQGAPANLLGRREVLAAEPRQLLRPGGRNHVWSGGGRQEIQRGPGASGAARDAGHQRRGRHRGRDARAARRVGADHLQGRGLSPMLLL